MFNLKRKETIMKVLRKIRLTQLSECELKKVQLKSLMGGNNCRCGSCSASTNSDDNMNANHTSGYTGTGDNDVRCKCPESSVYSTAVM